MTQNESDKIYDPVRKFWTKATPEEYVRQKLLQWLLDDLAIPTHRIEVEYAFSKAGVNTKDRADIVVWPQKVLYDKPTPWLLIECKSPSLSLTEEHLDQLLRYGRYLSAEYLALSNGGEFQLFQLVANNYVRCSSLTG